MISRKDIVVGYGKSVDKSIHPTNIEPYRSFTHPNRSPLFFHMNRPILPKRLIGTPSLGDKVAFTRTLTEADVALFIGTTWDVNPLHTDEIYCRETQFKHRIVPGLLTASLLTHLGGLWAFLATEMDFHFLAPVYVGDSITAQAEVVEINAQTGAVLLSCTCINQQGVQVLRANVRGFPGQFA